MSRIPHRAARRAFTLIELLVVVAIIAILASLLLPALQQARQAALSAACLGNQRQVGEAFFLYNDEYDCVIPAAFNANGLDRTFYGRWTMLATAYLDDGPDRNPNGDATRLSPVLDCPGVRRRSGGRTPTGDAIEASEPKELLYGYGMSLTYAADVNPSTNTLSGQATAKPDDEPSAKPFPSIFRVTRRPSEVFWIADGTLAHIGGFSGLARYIMNAPNGWYAWPHDFSETATDTGKNINGPAAVFSDVYTAGVIFGLNDYCPNDGFVSFRHERRTNMLFGDGAVRGLAWGSVLVRNVRSTYTDDRIMF